MYQAAQKESAKDPRPDGVKHTKLRQQDTINQMYLSAQEEKELPTGHDRGNICADSWPHQITISERFRNNKNLQFLKAHLLVQTGSEGPAANTS